MRRRSMEIVNLVRRAFKPKATNIPRRRPRHRPRSLRVEGLEDRRLLAAVVMTPQEQLLLELINRARQNPTAEVARYNIGLNDGLAPGTITTAAKQPLAPHQSLINAAGLHSQDMLDRDYFAHNNLQGLTPTQRATNSGYSGGGVGENIAWGGSTGSINQNQAVFERHEGLVRSAGHRQNIFSASYDELGNGVRYGVFTDDGLKYNASMVTEKFGASSNRTYITGVAFTDAVVADNFFTIGERVAGLTVRATSTQGTFETTTGPSGGYALQVPNGTYTVTFVGPSGQVALNNVGVNGSNIKVDLDTGDANWQPIAVDQLAFAGDVNADGSDDLIAWRNGQWIVAAAPRTGATGVNFATWSNAVTWFDLTVGDFNGDGRSDISARGNGNSLTVTLA